MPEVNQPVPEATVPVEQAPSGATAAPSASRPPLPWERPAPDPQPAHAAEVQAEPEAESAPPSDPSPTPAFDPEQIESLNQKAAQFDQLQELIAQEKARAAREAEMAQQDEEFQRRADEIWDIAQRYDTEDERRAYYHRQIRALRAETAQTLQQQLESERQQLEAERMAVALVGYPDHLGKLYDLGKDEIEDLRQFTDPTAMTVTAQAMKRMNERIGSMKQSVDQTYAAVTAQKQQAAIAPGSPSGAPASGELRDKVRSGTRESQSWLAEALGMNR